MPNWTTNRIRAAGPDTALDTMYKWLKNPSSNKNDRCIEQIRVFLLLGYAGYLKPYEMPEDPIWKQFCPFGTTSISTPQNHAYTELLRLLNEDPERTDYSYSLYDRVEMIVSRHADIATSPVKRPDESRNLRLTPALIKIVNNLYFQADLHFLDEGDFTVDQFYRMTDAWNLMGYDWSSNHEPAFGGSWDHDDVVEQHLHAAFFAAPGLEADFRTIVPPLLLPEIFGYNQKRGSHFQAPETLTGYDGYCHTYGVKWPNLSYPTSDGPDRGVLEAVGDTPWSPPHKQVYRDLMDAFGLTALKVTAIDEFDPVSYTVLEVGKVRKQKIKK